VAVKFFNEKIKFNLKKKRDLKNWINSVIHHHGFETGTVNFIFCSEEEILRINKEFLNHNYYTDIITFPYTESNIISADLFISVPTVEHNSQVFNQPFNFELNRVMVHGVLHLVGYNDSTEEEKSTMRKQEEYWLSKI
jgi:probable rRNA maturation factor